MELLRLAVVCCLILIFVTFPFETKGYEGLKKCKVQNVKNAYTYSKTVFVGEVLRVTEENGVKTFTFRVGKNWKGAKSKEIQVNVQETMHYQAWFKVREKYLVYASGSDTDENSEKLWERRCSRTKRLSDASEDMKELGEAKKSVKK
ncbi:MAG: hypothetical protein LC768_11255 [Acidobacteria bacterium]|nr:hypothetical protein [Acidobacteriota bacterium]MCA1638889.1 hypothetical protein [Acidobacteriota bacterium]